MEGVVTVESVYLPEVLSGVTLVAGERGLKTISFGELGIDRPGERVWQAAKQLKEYLAGERRAFDIELDLTGTPFQVQVWRELMKIPYGHTRSYRDIALAVNRPKGFQAIGQANTRNPIPVIVPCHRVIAADGSIGGYGGGLDKKRLLLDLENRNAH